MVVLGGGIQHFSVSPRPLGFGFGTKGLGPGLDKSEVVIMDCTLDFSK